MHMTQGYLNSLLNITAATLVKVGAGKLITVTVFAAGSTAGSVNDAASTGAAAAANQIAALPNAVGSYTFWFPFFNGLVITPGTGQLVSVSFE